MQLLNLQNRINELLSIFVAQVKGATAMGRTDINKVAETVLIPLFKEVYGYAELKNLNLVEGSNYPAVDLGDEKARVAIQVTSTSDSDKVKDTLSGFVKYKLYEKFDHLFIYILTEKQKTYTGRGYQDIIQNQFSFNKDTDIRDYRDLLAIISNLQADQLRRILSCLEGSIKTSYSNTPLRENVPYVGAEKFFVGREQEIKALDKLLLNQNRQNVVAISGMGGVGKTELAVQYAKRYLQLTASNAGGVCWVDAREGDIGSQILRFAHSHLDLNPPNDWDLSSKLSFCWHNWFSGDWLIVIDDVTDVDYNRQVQPYLPPKSKLFKVLLTSRVEIDTPVENLPIQTLCIEQALELLRLLIGSDRIDLELETAQEICDWLGYLPLGLELLGRYLRRDLGLSLHGMLALLKKQKLKSKAIREVEPRSPMTARYGVEAAFNLSWEKLSDAAKQLGCLLSLFALADIPWNLVEMVWNSLIGVEESDVDLFQETLQEARYELILFSFLQVVDSKKYRLHQLIREFLKVRREELEQDNFLKSHFVVMVTSLVGDLSGPLSYQKILELESAIPHLEEVAKDDNKDLQIYRSNEVVVAPFVGLGQFYRSQGLYSKAAQWLEQFLPLAEERFGAEHEVVFLGLNHLIATYFLQGRYSEAETLSQRFLNSSTAKDRHSVAAILGNLAGIYQGQGRYREAESFV
ncbi:MAG: SMEK domain-containing protein [Leptolyngbyaceae cyanobacterium SL_5_14]|nr:SMEK domain-containing protein [Leptolyngbyaceae cyanobacterium SL_5_14]